MNDEQKLIDDYFQKLNYEMDHRTWLYKIGLMETHVVLYFLEYGI